MGRGFSPVSGARSRLLEHRSELGDRALVSRGQQVLVPLGGSLRRVTEVIGDDTQGLPAGESARHVGVAQVVDARPLGQPNRQRRGLEVVTVEVAAVKRALPCGGEHVAVGVGREVRDVRSELSCHGMGRLTRRILSVLVVFRR